MVSVLPIVLLPGTRHLFVVPYHQPLMIEPAVMICEDHPGPVAARAVNILIENIQTGIGFGTGIEIEIEIGTWTGIEIDIGIEKEKGTEIKKRIGTKIGTERDTGTGTETGIETGTESGRGRESRVMIMTGSPNMQREKVGGTMRGAAVMLVGIIVVGAEVEAGAEVGACKLALHMVIVIQVHKEMGARRRHLHLAI